MMEYAALSPDGTNLGCLLHGNLAFHTCDASCTGDSAPVCDTDSLDGRILKVDDSSASRDVQRRPCGMQHLPLLSADVVVNIHVAFDDWRTGICAGLAVFVRHVAVDAVLGADLVAVGA